MWHSSQAANKGSNAISYKNSRVDEILETIRREFDAKKRVEMYKEFQQILHEEQPYTFLFVRKHVCACIAGFENVEIFPGRFDRSIGGYRREIKNLSAN